MFISETDNGRLCLYQLLLDPGPALQPLVSIHSPLPGPAIALVHASAVWAPDDSAVLVWYLNVDRERDEPCDFGEVSAMGKPDQTCSGACMQELILVMCMPLQPPEVTGKPMMESNYPQLLFCSQAPS